MEAVFDAYSGQLKISGLPPAQSTVRVWMSGRPYGRFLPEGDSLVVAFPGQLINDASFVEVEVGTGDDAQRLSARLHTTFAQTADAAGPASDLMTAASFVDILADTGRADELCAALDLIDWSAIRSAIGDEQFIHLLFNVILGRAASDKDEEFYRQFLSDEGSPRRMTHRLIRSKEFLRRHDPLIEDPDMVMETMTPILAAFGIEMFDANAL